MASQSPVKSSQHHREHPSRPLSSHPLSYWQRQAGLPTEPSREALRRQTRAPSERAKNVDLCIVGAGLVGSSAAYLAVQRGLNVVVVDAREPALGASGRNAGMVLSGIAQNYAEAVRIYGREQARNLWQLTTDNREQMLSTAEELGVPYDRCGSWLLADVEEEAELLAESSRLLRQDGFSHDYSGTDPLDRGFLAGIYRPHDAVIDPARFTRALLHASTAQVVSNTTVSELRQAPGGSIELVARETDPPQQLLIHAERALICTNAYSSLLHSYFADRIRPCRGQIQITEPTSIVFHQAGYSHFGYWYFRQIPDPNHPGRGRWLIGGGRHLHPETENDTFDESLNTALQADLQAYTARYFPELADVRIAYRWAGIMGFTATGLPLVGGLPDLPQAAFCVGFNGHGMGLAFKLAECALGVLLDGADPGIFGSAGD